MAGPSSTELKNAPPGKQKAPPATTPAGPPKALSTLHGDAPKSSGRPVAREFHRDTGAVYRVPRSPLAESTRIVGWEGVAAAREALGIDRRDEFFEKVVRLLATGSVDVVGRDDEQIVADVLGDSGRHRVQLDSYGWWSCSCACLGARCSHIAAVKLVTGFGARA